jgi:hypothetical protein
LYGVTSPVPPDCRTTAPAVGRDLVARWGSRRGRWSRFPGAVEETIKRREGVQKRMLSTPHKPHKLIGKKKAASDRRKSAKKCDK